MSTPAATAPPADGGAFQSLDDSHITKAQLKIMFISGMGFFTDAYDLFVIGIVVSLLKTEWTSVDQPGVVAEFLHAAGLGRGRARVRPSRGHTRTQADLRLRGADPRHRRTSLGVRAQLQFLLICRIILGIGIGGDYPVSATIMSEYSGKRDRGKMVGLVFAMQGAGLIFGPLFASVLLWSGLSDDAVWRILLAFGAVPGMAVFYLRRRIHETPRFAMAGGAADEASGGHQASRPETTRAPAPVAESKARNTMSVAQGYLLLLQSKRMLIWLIGAAGAWALLDFCYYGNTISTPEILKLLNPHASLLHNTLIQLAIFAIFAVPGYIVAILLLDKSGRRSIQVLGFGMMGLMFLLIGLIPAVTTTALAVRPAVRDQLLLHRVRAQHDDVHLSGRDLPDPGPHHRPRHIGRGREAGRVPRRLPLPGLPQLLARRPRRGDNRRDRRLRRHAADHRDPA